MSSDKSEVASVGCVAMQRRRRRCIAQQGATHARDRFAVARDQHYLRVLAGHACQESHTRVPSNYKRGHSPEPERAQPLEQRLRNLSVPTEPTMKTRSCSSILVTALFSLAITAPVLAQEQRQISGTQTITASSASIKGVSPTVTVNPSVLAITSGAPPSGTVGTQYDFISRRVCVKWAPPPPYGVCEKWGWQYQPGFPLAATGGTGLTWSWSARPGSSLPPGLSISGSYIVGTPTRVGSYAVVITVTDSARARASLPYTLTFGKPAPPTISTLTSPQGATVNQPYSYTFATSGYAVTLSATGKLPAGLAPVTRGGVLAGRPSVLGIFPIVVKAVDGVGQSVTQDFSIEVFPHGFGPTGSMKVLRFGHTATLLSTGHVLVTGGETAGVYGSIASAEIFDPSTQKFAATASMTTARSDHTATLLCDLTAASCANHKVLIAGGWGLDPYTLPATEELFDPSTGTFTSTGSLNDSRFAHTATLLGNGKVLIAAGAVGGSRIASAELYDPHTGTFTRTGSLTTTRSGHTATLLANGKVLITGGANDAGNQLASAELYDPVAGTFTATGSMHATRFDHTATRLPDGKVLIVGGYDTGAATAELYDPAKGTFAETGTLTPQRAEHAAVLLPNGTVLVAGGYNLENNLLLADAELFNPQTGTFSGTGGLQTAREYLVMTALGKSGHVLLTGGFGPQTASVAAEVYQ